MARIRLAAFFLIPLFLTPLLFGRLIARSPAVFPEFGENDFLEYWAAGELYRSGSDLYDPASILRLEQRVGWKEPLPLMMWNPPWTLTLLSPLLGADFELAGARFLGLNFLLLTLSAILVLDAIETPRRFWPLAALAGICSIPVYFALLLGQLSVVLTFATAGVFWSVQKERLALCGAFLLLSTLKPHVIFLLLVLVVVALGIRRLLVAGSCAAAFFGATLLVETWQSPNALRYWLNRGAHRGDPLLVDVLQWRTTAVTTQVRDLMNALTGDFPSWPLIAVPAAAVTVLCGLIFRARGNFDWQVWAARVIPLSCFSSPFSWLFDASVTVVTQTAIAGWAFSGGARRSERFAAIASVLLLNLVLLVHLVLWPSSYDRYWYFAPMLFVLSVRFSPERKNTSFVSASSESGTQTNHPEQRMS